MTFRDILSLRFDECTNLVCRDDVVRLFPNVPLEVVQQVFIEHGRNPDFQKQYGHIDLELLTWKKVAMTGDELRSSSHFERFDSWFKSCNVRALSVAKKGWKYIDSRQNVVEHWEKHQTWLLPPVLIAGSLVCRDSALHLVEGHTRLGLLTGLIEADVIDETRCHEVWVGRPTSILSQFFKS